MLRNEFRKDPRLPILIGDGNFIQLVRKGIDEEAFVYKAGDLLLGKGDPWADIKIDDNAFVYTLAFAKQQGLWPRTVPKVVGGAGEPIGGAGPTPATPQPTPPSLGVEHFSSEAPLKQALTRIWEAARVKKVKKLRALSLRVFDRTDAFKLLSACKQVPNAERSVQIQAAYETASSSSLELDFKGALDDAEVLKEFLEAQFRAASETDLRIQYVFGFPTGLDLSTDTPEKITERLARYASGTAYVTAEAESEKS
jgi:hypothetical protein